MDLGINDRVAMVAAASKGLGRAIAEALAAEGCRLSVCSRSRPLEPVRPPSAMTLSVACDVSKAEDLQRWYDATIERFGQVDILVTNTGGPPAAPFLKLTEEQWAERHRLDAAERRTPLPDRHPRHAAARSGDASST